MADKVKVLSNKWLRIEVGERGAEVRRVTGQRTGTEYLWNGDPAYWNRQSPLLFPIVGKLNGNTAIIHDMPYVMEKHGFVSNALFKCKGKVGNTITYELISTPSMHRMFPCPFRLEVMYRVRRNTLKVQWTVWNTGLDYLPFQIGGHPGINYPDYVAGEKVKGYIRVKGKGWPYTSLDVADTGCLSTRRYELPFNTDGILPVTDDLFKKDAIILDQKQVSELSLLDKQQKPYVTLETTFPVTLVWAPAGVDSPFVCLEPWQGLPDIEGSVQEFSNRPYTVVVPPGHYSRLYYEIHCDREVHIERNPLERRGRKRKVSVEE